MKAFVLIGIFFALCGCAQRNALPVSTSPTSVAVLTSPTSVAVLTSPTSAPVPTPLFLADSKGADDENHYHSQAIAIRFSRDSTRLLSAGAITNSKNEPTDKRLRVWKVKSGREICRLPTQPISPDRYSLPGVQWVGNTLLIPDFKTMLTTWGSWEVKPILIHSFRIEKPIKISDGVITSLALSPDEKTLAIGMTGAVEFRDAHTYKLLHTYGHSGQATHVYFGPNSSTVALAFLYDNQPQLINVQNAHRMARPAWFDRVQGADAFAFSPNGKQLSIAKAQTIEIWTTPNSSDMGHKLKTLKTVLPVVWRLQFSPDGKTLAAGGLSKTLTPVEFFALSK